MTKVLSNSRKAAHAHDHASCVEAAVQTAERVCRERNLRFTAQRKKILELVWNSHKPVGAYDILDILQKSGQRAAPPTVYRALEFLIEADLVHRLDSINAFVGCPDPENPHAGQFLICERCRSVTEFDDGEINSLVARKAGQQGFAASRQTLEIQGVCRLCAEDGNG